MDLYFLVLPSHPGEIDDCNTGEIQRVSYNRGEEEVRRRRERRGRRGRGEGGKGEEGKGREG